MSRRYPVWATPVAAVGGILAAWGIFAIGSVLAEQCEGVPPPPFPRFGSTPPPFDSGPLPDGGQCHRQCRVTFPPDGSSNYGYVCGPCEYFCVRYYYGVAQIIPIYEPPLEGGLCPISFPHAEPEAGWP
jgi:hypothetical protein